MNTESNEKTITREEAKKRALKFLQQRKTAVVATASRQGDPQASTLFYSIDDDFTLGFITDKQSRKWKNIMENPHVAMVIGMGPDVMTIQCGGHAEVIDYLKETDKAEKVIRAVIEHSKIEDGPAAMPVLMNPKVELGIFTVKPSWMVMLNMEVKKNEDDEYYPEEYLKILP